MNNEFNPKLRDELFPDGKPEPDEFIIALAELAKQIKEMNDEHRAENNE